MSAATRAPEELLVTNATVVTLGEPNLVLPDHAVLCEGGVISRIAPASAFAGQSLARLDARGGVVMPGLINAHMHFYSTLVRGLGKAEPSCDFREVLEHLWWRLDRKLTLEDCYYSALIALIGAIRQGTTTLIDHHASPFAVPGSLDVIAEAVKLAGLRACLCYEVSDRDGARISQEGLAENARFIRRCRAERSPHLRALVGLHASFTLTDATLERAASLGAELETGFHIHVAEALSDQEHCRATFGMRVVERLQRFGLLGPRSIAAHCVHVDDREVELLAASGTAVVHNPQSNMNNAVGIADAVGMLARGVLVGLGTDAMTVDMLEEVRVALWLAHLGRHNPSVGFVEVLSTLLANNPRIAGRCWEGGIGALAPGLPADLIIVDYTPPTPFDAGTFLGHLAFGISQARVDTTIVGGRVLMKEGRLQLDLDEREVAARSRECAAALWERF